MSEVVDNVQQPQPDPVEEGESSTQKFQFTWQDLNWVGKHINETQWSQVPLPAVLETLPQNIVLSEKLQRILSWSLQRHEPTPKPTPEPSTPASLHESVPLTVPDESSSTEGEGEGEGTILTPPKSDGSERSTTSSGGRSRKTSNLFARLMRLRQDVAVKRAASVRHKEKIAAISIPAPLEEAPKLGECISCFDEYPKPELIHLSCSHDYCKSCLREVVMNAMKTESAFPPKCCLSEIPRKQILSCLDSEERDEYKDKSAEYSIPAGHRWYCPEPKCAKWIKPEKLHRERKTHQVCPHCKVNICSICRSLAHDQDEDCPQDFGLESTLEIADSEGWRRCYSCRTMVELTAGCRHITCRCGAEFCYVCNARWRTCNCTEADKERRIAELRARREERTREQEEADAAVEAEAEEIAEAIRQIEQMELAEAVRREEEERQRQLEEELMLARLEEERLLEEIARREAEEEMERQLRETLLTSSREECQTMMSTLMQIINFQHAALMSDHESRELKCLEKKETDQERHSGKVSKNTKWLEANIKKRRDILNERQTGEQQSLQLQAEEEEDEMFMQMHIYLKDKANREAREKKMRTAFQKQQTERQEELSKRHEEERRKLEESVYFEREGLRKAASIRLDPIVKEFQASLKTLGSQIGGDRKWFQMVSTRRIAMVKEHQKIVLGQVKAQEEPVGLTEELSKTIEPILPALDSNQPESPRDDPTPNVDKAVPLSATVQQLQEEEDMYGPSINNPSKTLAQEPNTTTTTTTAPHRSGTIVRSIPGAYPATQPSSIDNNMNTVPILGQPQVRRYNNIERQSPGAVRNSRTGAVSMSGMTAMAFTPPDPPQTIKPQYQPQQQQQPRHQQQPQPQRPTPPLTEAQQPQLTLLSTSTSTFPDTISPIHSRHQSASTTTTASSTRFSNASISPISSKHSSTVTDTEILDGMAANIVASGDRPAKRGFFRSQFRRKAPLSEEEIRGRMVGCVGDGL